MITMTILNKIKQIYAGLQFWWVKRTLLEGRDFKLSISNEVDETLRAMICSGKFAGIEFAYSNMSLKDVDAGLLEFNTKVVYNPNDDVDVFTKEFENLTSNILRVILSKGIAQYKVSAELEQELTDENRKNDTDELDEEREFHEEVSPLLEKRVSKRKPGTKGISRSAGVHLKVQPASKSKRNKTGAARKNKPHGK
jgi:hypothetical protein